MVFAELLNVVAESSMVLSTAPNLRQRMYDPDELLSPGLWTQFLGSQWRKGAWLLAYVWATNSVNIVLASLIPAGEPKPSDCE